MQTKPGVASNGNSTTVINGLRTSYSNMTLDGINIQDNYIRDNALDYSPNKLRVGQVRQMTLITSNPKAAASGGATETAFSTPTGGNQFHGEVFWYNRNNYFAANDWFNNQAGIGRPFLNQNQFGGDIGGPIRKDKLFFYGSYEGIRAHQQMPQNFTILTPDARNGIFTYTSGGVTRKVNLLALRESDRRRSGHAADPGAGSRPATRSTTTMSATAETPAATASTSAITNCSTTSPARSTTTSPRATP